MTARTETASTALQGDGGRWEGRSSGVSLQIQTQSKEKESMSSMTSQSPENNPEGETPASAVGAGSVLSPWSPPSWSPPSWSREVTDFGGMALVSFTVDACPVIPVWSREDSAWSVVSVEQAVELVDVDGVAHVAGKSDVRVDVQIPAGRDIGMSPAQAWALSGAIDRAARYAVDVAGARPDTDPGAGGRALAARQVRDEPELVSVEGWGTPSFDVPTDVPAPSWATEARGWEWDGDKWTREVLRPWRLKGGGGFDITALQDAHGDGSWSTSDSSVSFDLKDNEISDLEDMRQIGVWLIEVASVLMVNDILTERDAAL